MRASEGETSCRNCGRQAAGRFCSHCGQEIQIRRGPLLEILQELVAEWWSLDSRLLRSLGALPRPGRLSELYVAGKRAPFLRPFRLYLLASLVLFSTLLAFEVPDAAGIELRIGGEIVGEPATGTLRRSISFLEPDGVLGRWTLDLAGDRVDRLRALPGQEILTLLFTGFKRWLPSTLILFVPFLALGLKLLYVRGRARHTLYVDHLVFAIHFQSALFFALAAVWLIASLLRLDFGPRAIAYVVVGLAVLLVYLPLALRRFYGQSRRWTALKTLALLYVYLSLLGLAVQGSVVATIWKV